MYMGVFSLMIRLNLKVTRFVFPQPKRMGDMAKIDGFRTNPPWAAVRSNWRAQAAARGGGTPCPGAAQSPQNQRNIAKARKTLVFGNPVCYTQSAFDAASGTHNTSTHKKEGFIERVDIACLVPYVSPRGRWLSPRCAKLRAVWGVWRKGGNIWPLFLIAFEKAASL